MYDIIDEYFPELDELTPVQMASARASVISYLQPHFPDQDMAPGSVFGDMFVSPAAAFLAALTVSQNRFMSDLDLSNVANGVIFSCDFVAAYLGNFAVKDISTLQSSGLVRLTFSENAEFLVNRGVKFQFGTDDLFYPRLASVDTDDFLILPAGSIPDSGANEVALSQTSLGTWAVDLPLTGKMTADVTRGAPGMSSLTIPSLVGISAAVTFEYGLPPVSLPALAEMARRTAYAASVGSRNGTRSFVAHQWPETKVVSVVSTGDPELQRTTPGTALALASPAADIYFRSTRDSQEESQTVRLPFDSALRKFRGPVGFLHRPGKIVDLRYAGDTALTMVSVTLYSQVNSARFPGSTGCGTPEEEFWFDVEPPEDGAGVILVPRVADDGDGYAMFAVTYLADPLLEPVSAMLTSSDNTPVGLDVAVKAGPLIEVQSMVISFRRKPGVTTALDTARSEIAAYVNGVGWPDLYSEAPIIESMYAAGALRTQGVGYEALLTITPANRRFEKGFDPDVDPDWDAVGASLPCPSSVILTAFAMRPSVVVSSTVNGVVELYAVSDRNVRYYVKPSNITFQEVK